MKLRRERRGLHYYDRNTGLHCLLDEMPVPPDLCNLGPATVSIAVTNACDLHCHFCYAAKTPDALQASDVLDWCRQLDSLGTLEIAFGGGEPTLFPRFGDLCSRIWHETGLGISVTTHGHRLSTRMIDLLEGTISILRFSIDGPEPEYSVIRQRPLDEVLAVIRRASKSIPVGINTVVTKRTLHSLDRLAEIIRGLTFVDWLLLPETSSGMFVLSDDEWRQLRMWVESHQSDFRLCISTQATPMLGLPVLLPEEAEDYAHIDASGRLRRCSYGSGGISLRGVDLNAALRQLWRGCPSNAALPLSG